VSRGRGRLGPDFAYHGLRVAALAVAGIFWLLQGVPELPRLVLALALAQGVAATVYLAAAHRRLCGGWTGLASSVWAPTLAAHALAGLLHWLLPPAAGGGRVEAIWALAAPTVLWLPAASVLLAALLLSPAERQAALQRLPRPWSWRNA
jgi:hypothetical protein